MASTNSPENDAVYDGLSRQGMRLVSFAPVLKERDSPILAALDRLLELGRWGMNTDVEIEFAVELDPSGKGSTQFGFLQMRPMAVSRELEELDIEEVEPEGYLLLHMQDVLNTCKSAHEVLEGKGLTPRTDSDYFSLYDSAHSW